MPSKIKIEKIKEYLPLGITCSLIISYFSVFGYYNSYGIDITSFISIEDLLTIYLKTILLTFAYAAFMLLVLYSFYKKIVVWFRTSLNKLDWLDKTIGKSIFLKRSVPIAIILATIISLIFYFNLKSILGLVFTYAMVLGLIVAGLFFLYDKLVNSDKIHEIAISVSFLALFSCAIPFGIGHWLTRFSLQPNIELTLDNEKTLTSNEDLIYIGKTHDYYFFQELTPDKKSIIIPASEVKQITFF